MSAPSSATHVELPQWYARVSRAGAIAPEREAHGAIQLGALTIWQDGRGCETARFGGDSGAVVFDGYLFDRVETARELNLSDTAAQADIVAAAYVRWGHDLFDRLDGCYLAAIWDGASRTLLLGHDALGRHPAFYAADAEHVWFAPNVLALARSGRIAARPNRLSFALHAIGFWPEAGQTFFETIHRVRPGSYVQATAERVAEHQYWVSVPDDDGLLTEQEVHDEFEPALIGSVRRCLALDAQGIMLSGGVDSVTVAALAAPEIAARGREPLVAVSARTGHRLSSEEEMQSKVTAALHMPHRISTTGEWIGTANPLKLSLDLTLDLPAPGDVWWLGTYTAFYRRTAAEGLSVLLTGSGGDNWLGVSSAYAADLLRSLKLAELYRFVKADVGTGGSSLRRTLRRLAWSGGLRWHADTVWTKLAPAAKSRYHRRKWMERLPSWLAPDRALRSELIDRLMARRAPSLAPGGATPRSYYLHVLRTTDNPFMHHELETAFHVESQCGLRLLSPYHDRRLVSFFNRIPPRVLMHGARYKGLLRSVAARHLPGLGLEDQRKDYPLDFQKRKLEDTRRAMSEVWPAFSFDGLGRLGIIDACAMTKAYASSRELPFEGLGRAFALMSAERWLEHNVKA